MRWLVPRQGFRGIIGVLVLAACEQSIDLFPIHPGSGNVGVVTVPDASIDSPPDAAGFDALDASLGEDALDAGILFSGQVCVLTDARRPTACESTRAGGLSVQLDGSFATTADGGTFTLTRPTGSNLAWHVTGVGITPASKQFGAVTTIPAIAAPSYDQMLVAVRPTVIAGDGALVLQLTRAGNAVVGARIVVTPAPDSLVYYDGASPIEWPLTATGTFGAAWVPSVPIGTASVTVDTGTTQVFNGIPVVADTVTFAHLELQ